MLGWIAAQDWCDGRIGMWGTLWQGQTPLAAASTGNPHLKAVMPSAAWMDAYGTCYPGGICNRAFAQFFVWSTTMLDSSIITPVDTGADGGVLAQARAGRGGAAIGQTMTDALWRAFPFRGTEIASGQPMWEFAAAAAGSDAYTVDYGTTTGGDTRWAAVNREHAYGDLAAMTPAPSATPAPRCRHPCGRPALRSCLCGSARWRLTWASSPTLRRPAAGGRPTYVTEGALRASHRAAAEPPYDNLGLPYHDHCPSHPAAGPSRWRSALSHPGSSSPVAAGSGSPSPSQTTATSTPPS